MRLYCFGLTQLKQLHQGVQNTHSTVELFVKYANKDEPVAKYDMLMDWSTNHKTAIFLDGGFASDLMAVRAALLTSPYPWCEFHEDEATLFGIMTSVSVVIPPAVYEAAEHVRNGGVLVPSMATGKVFFKTYVLTPWDISFIEVLNKHRLAS